MESYQEGIRQDASNEASLSNSELSSGHGDNANLWERVLGKD